MCRNMLLGPTAMLLAPVLFAPVLFGSVLASSAPFVSIPLCHAQAAENHKCRERSKKLFHVLSDS